MYNEGQNNQNIIFTRHSLKDGEGLSEAGINLAIKKGTTELAQTVGGMELGTIFVFVGVSSSPRTRQTLALMTQGLKSAMDPDTHVVDADELDSKRGSHPSGLRYIINTAKSEPNKKIVVGIPLQLKELSDPGGIITPEGNLHPYFEYLDKFAEEKGLSESEEMLMWLSDYEKSKNQDEDFDGPNPEKIAKRLLAGTKRLVEFTKQNLPEDQKGRPIVIGFVGHSWELDALLAYTMGGAAITKESIIKLQGKMINEAEMGRVEIKDNIIRVHYRGIDIQSSLETVPTSASTNI